MVILHRQPSEPLTCGRAIVDNIQQQLKQAHENVVKCIAIESVRDERECFSGITSGVTDTLKLSKNDACTDVGLSPYRTDADEWAKFESYEQTAIVEVFAGEALIEPASRPTETVFPLLKVKPADVLHFPDMLTLVERSIDHIYNQNCQRDVIRVKYAIVGAYNETNLCRNRRKYPDRETQTTCREGIVKQIRDHFAELKHLKDCTEAVSPNAHRVHTEYGLLLGPKLSEYLADYVRTTIKPELVSDIYRVSTAK